MADETYEASGAQPHHIEPRTALLIIAGVVLVAVVIISLFLHQGIDVEIAPPALSEEERRAQEAREEFAQMLERSPAVSEEDALAAREAFIESTQEREPTNEEEAMAARAEFTQSAQ